MKRQLLGYCLVGALVAAGCSNDSDGADTTAAATTDAATDSTEATTPATDPGSPVTDPTGTPAASDVQLVEFVAGLSRPVDMVWRDGDAAPYLVQQGGTIVRVRDGQVAETALDVTALIASEGEQGLLGFDFHPSLPLAYVYYTDRRGDTVVAEYAVADDGMLDAASARTVLQVEQPHANHNGGKIVFGPDGYLYIGLGDGGAANDPDRRSLDTGDLLGKLLRIDPAADGGDPYTIPSDNPFVDDAGARPEIWSIGLRNPWRFGFDSATGDLWIGDVGQGEWEEIDVARAADGGGKGLNFGWSAWEGSHRFNEDQFPDGATPPVYEYPHGDAGCSVSGGTVYRGSAIDSLRGWYLFSDYCSGRIWALHVVDGGAPDVVELSADGGSVVAIVADPEGELYILDQANGRVVRVEPA